MIKTDRSKNQKIKRLKISVIFISLLIGMSVIAGATAPSYQLHTGISTTYFWVGEQASSENGYIPNSQSAWDDAWKKHFGGEDTPGNRNGYNPAGFTPKENPFYFALPYNDIDTNGNMRTNSPCGTSYLCKNQWIKIIKSTKTAYAQWEDVGPYSEDDFNYVFGSSIPKNTENNHGGLDVSPAVRDYLGLADVDTTSWQFVDYKDVPEGPWKNIITTSPIYWDGTYYTFGKSASPIDASGSMPPSTSIEITYPNGGEKLLIKNTYKIEWNSTGNIGQFVKIQLFKGRSLSKTLVSNTSNDGSYDWYISGNQAIGTDYKIKVTSKSNSMYNDKSDNNFKIS